MNDYDKIIEECAEDKGFTIYHKQGFTLMLILLFLIVNLVERQVTISEQKQHVIAQDFEVCLTSVCLGGDLDNTTECISLVYPTLSNVTIINDRYSRIKGVKRIMVRPLSDCQ